VREFNLSPGTTEKPGREREGKTVHATTVVGYTYAADTYCHDCIVDVIGPLDERAEALGIDTDDERSYDSDDFPKVVFASQVEDAEYCGSCHELLLDC
jgi:hypothetical protein